MTLTAYELFTIVIVSALIGWQWGSFGFGVTRVVFNFDFRPMFLACFMTGMIAGYLMALLFGN